MSDKEDKKKYHLHMFVYVSNKIQQRPTNKLNLSFFHILVESDILIAHKSIIGLKQKTNRKKNVP